MGSSPGCSARSSPPSMTSSCSALWASPHRPSSEPGAPDGAGVGADAPDRGDLLAERQDRLDLEGRADHRPRAADPPALPQVLEGVQAEPDVEALTGLLDRGEDLPCP